ncbi:MAG: membrane lipoprotein lipid attachment site-containing protein [Oscillospiraceae bacterium]|nr:membrane lipoprotein lipid attachment site-containing protein [Oscillospiraceae bacterium]
MKKIAFILVFLLLFAGCSGESGAEPASLPYLTPFASFVPNDEVDFVYFLADGSGDYIKSRYALASGTEGSLPKDSSFIFSGEEQIFTGLALTTENICSDGEYYYHYGTVPGKGAHLFRTADFETEEAVAKVGGMGMVLNRMSYSGEYIICPSNTPNAFSLTYYDTETG